MEGYSSYIWRKTAIIGVSLLALALCCVLAINAGAARLAPGEVLQALIGLADERGRTIVINIRLPRVLAAVLAGAGLALAGSVLQNILRNPLASPFTLGISQGAAFGAAVAIVGFGAGSLHAASQDAVIISNPYLVTLFAFGGALSAALIIIFLARLRGTSPEVIVLAGVALGSLFSAGTVLIQYFASDVEVASIIFWTFGDVGRASYPEIAILGGVTVLTAIYFFWQRWNYNALLSGEDTARSLGVEVAKTRLLGMFAASLVVAAAVSFLGIIGFIGLVSPHLMRRLIGDDFRFLLPAAALSGSVLLLAADTVARTVISPVVLPVGVITSFLGAPLFLYLLFQRRQA